MFFCSFASAEKCEEDLISNFENTWDGYYSNALLSDGYAMEKYFSFPLKLNGEFDGEKPTLLSKKFLLKYYSLIFIKNKFTKNTVFFKNFNSLRSYKLRESDLNRIKWFCNGKVKSGPSIRFGDIVLKWIPTNGWKITEIFYDTDDKNYLFSSINPNMEFAYP